MRKLSLIAALAAATTLAGCITAEQQARLEQTMARIRAGAAVAAETTRQALDEVCAASVQLNAGAQTAIAIAESRKGPGANPKTDKAIRDINTAMSTLAAVCASGNVAPSAYASLALKAWAAYQTIQAAQRDL